MFDKNNIRHLNPCFPRQKSCAVQKRTHSQGADCASTKSIQQQMPDGLTQGSSCSLEGGTSGKPFPSGLACLPLIRCLVVCMYLLWLIQRDLTGITETWWDGPWRWRGGVAG